MANIILLNGENISFDASLVTHTHTHTYIYVYTHTHTHTHTNIPPIMIMNKMYENQHLLYIIPLIRENNFCLY
jgi:hypothetical protein